MTIDTNELRRLVQAATPGPWMLRTAPTSAGLCHIISAADWRGAFIYGDGLRIGVDDSLPKAQELAANARLIAAANPEAISELLDRLEAAEKERDILRDKLALESQENGALRDSVDRACEERDALRAKVERTEKQEPIGEMLEVSPHNYELRWYRPVPFGAKLYALPGAKPQPSAPDTYAAGINAVAAMLQSKAAEYAKEHGHDDMGGLSFGSGMGGEIKMDYYTNLIELADDVRAMIAAAPEAKPCP